MTTEDSFLLDVTAEDIWGVRLVRLVNIVKEKKLEGLTLFVQLVNICKLKPYEP